jgi:putative ABC transport system permease protein
MNRALYIIAETGFYIRRILSIIGIALQALRRNKLRSILTALGIIIGVGAVIAMIGVGQGAKSQVEAQIASLGRNVILVYAGSISRGGVHSGWGSVGTLTIPDTEAIRREISEVVGVSPEVRRGFQVAAGNRNWSTNVIGGSADYFEIRQWQLNDGAPFTDTDVRSSTKVCVIGTTVASQLFENEDAIGQVIRISNVPFIVVGLLASKGLSVMGSDQDDCIIMPYTSAMKRLMGGTTLRSVLISTEDAADLSSVQQQVTDLLRQRHRIAEGKEDDFTVRTQEEIAQMATATSKVMSLLLAAIACVSLVVGGIGIMNIMLVSVTERTREIGIRMAVGARPRDILLQFLIEAITLSSLGGLIGIGIGLGASKLISALADWPTLVSAAPIIISFVFSAVIGIFFGFYPARKAAQLDPIEALRYE